MVKFGAYLQSVIQQKPEWSKAYIDYEYLNDMLTDVKRAKRRANALPPESIVTLLTSQPASEKLATPPGSPNSVREVLDGSMVNEQDIVDDIEREPLINALRRNSRRNSMASMKSETVASEYAHSAAESFVHTLNNEVAKVRDFATEICAKCATYFDERKVSGNASSTRRRIDYIRYVYQEMNQLQLYLDMNVVVIRKLVKKYNNRVIVPELQLDAPTVLEHLSAVSQSVADLRVRLELFIAQEYTSGDLSKAKETITREGDDARVMFRVGFLVAACISCVLYIVHIVCEVGVSDECLAEFWDVFPVYRVMAYVCLVMWLWSLVLYVMVRRNINYLFILELHPVTRMTTEQVLEVAGLWTFGTLVSASMFLRFRTCPTHNVEWMGGILPLLFVLFCVYPVRKSFRDGRHTLFDIIFRMFLLPMGSVRFRDFFVADWATSAPGPMTDTIFTAVYIINGFSVSTSMISSRQHYQFVIALLPYYWRACQTVKMFRATHQRVHLINTGKYCMLFIAALCQGIEDWTDTSSAAWAVGLFMILKFLASTYAFAWDILMDWGWIKGKERGRMFRGVRVYVAVAVLDFFGRYFFLMDSFWFKKFVGNAAFATMCSSSLELVRRGMWSILRIENENVNNLEKYRTVDFVPAATFLQAQ
eukprot:PhM_4_TR14122/c0_g1_i1/m.91049